MAETDYVVRKLVLKKEAAFELDKLYKIIRSWLDKKHYIEFNEKEYSDKGSDLKIKFIAKKSIDDYNKYRIDISIKVKDHSYANVKGKKVSKGNLTLEFESCIERDYEEHMEGNFVKKFFADFFQRFLSGEKESKLHSELEEETYALYNETKAFLNLARFE